MNIRTAKILGILLLLILATALCGLGLSLGSAESNRDGNHSFADKTGEGYIDKGTLALTDTPVVTPTLTPTPFSHPLLFPPVNTNANVSIGIDEACVQILDGPCTNMWTYGGTYPGITIRRATGQTTNVTFTNNLDPAAGELTVHNHGNHSSATKTAN
jgi:FtsP/CotA-like multicopper oxidase with cupredoxin domain